MDNKEQVDLPDDEVNPRLLELIKKFKEETISEEEDDELRRLIEENRNTKRNQITRNAMEHENFVNKLWEKYC